MPSRILTLESTSPESFENISTGIPANSVVVRFFRADLDVTKQEAGQRRYHRMFNLELGSVLGGTYVIDDDTGNNYLKIGLHHQPSWVQPAIEISPAVPEVTAIAAVPEILAQDAIPEVEEVEEDLDVDPPIEYVPYQAAVPAVPYQAAVEGREYQAAIAAVIEPSYKCQTTVRECNIRFTMSGALDQTFFIRVRDSDHKLIPLDEFKYLMIQVELFY
ncbi:hypothetical protein BASA81_002064 [Batrachochytrium salamandrivorans]|nr:hypothetical protein BASA81_002064 [Batrachochytrium salamandrivorans]